MDSKRDEIHIGNVGGDVVGVGVSGSGNIIGKNITISQTTYIKLEPEFRNSLEEFLALLNKYGGQLTEDQKRSLQQSVDSLAKEAEGLKPEEVVTDEGKVDEIKSKQISLAEKIVEYIPQVAESIASVTPLAPFSKVIGKGTEYFAEWIRRKLGSK
jgi:plasmid maintenance system antidote protein VapI